MNKTWYSRLALVIGIAVGGSLIPYALGHEFLDGKLSRGAGDFLDKMADWFGGLLILICVAVVAIILIALTQYIIGDDVKKNSAE